MMQSNLGKLIQLTNTFYFSIESLGLLALYDIFLVIGGENDSWEIMTILWPWEGIEKEVIRIIDDIILWIFGKFGLEGFEDTWAKLSLGVELVIWFIGAKYFHPSLRVASYILTVHRPNWLCDVLYAKKWAIFNSDLRWAFYIFLLEIACYLWLCKDNILTVFVYLDVLFLFFLALVEKPLAGLGQIIIV